MLNFYKKYDTIRGKIDCRILVVLECNIFNISGMQIEKITSSCVKKSLNGNDIHSCSLAQMNVTIPIALICYYSSIILAYFNTCLVI
jgi:hypothetical protein